MCKVHLILFIIIFRPTLELELIILENNHRSRVGLSRWHLKQPDSFHIPWVLVLILNITCWEGERASTLFVTSAIRVPVVDSHTPNFFCWYLIQCRVLQFSHTWDGSIIYAGLLDGLRLERHPSIDASRPMAMMTTIIMTIEYQF